MGEEIIVKDLEDAFLLEMATWRYGCKPYVAYYDAEGETLIEFVRGFDGATAMVNLAPGETRFYRADLDGIVHRLA